MKNEPEIAHAAPTTSEEWDDAMLRNEVASPDGGTELLNQPAHRYLAPLVRPGQLVVEAGSGNGRFVFAYAAAGARAVGVDFSPTLAARVHAAARHGETGSATALAGDILALPFVTGSVDLYTSFGVYEHFRGAQHDQLFAEAWRVLKPGGLVYIDVPHRWSAWTVRRAGRYWYRRLRPPALVWQRNMSRPYLRRRAEKAGFTTVATHVHDAWSAFERGFSLGQPTLLGVPHPLRFLEPWFRRLANRCERREWLGHTLVYIGRKPTQS